MELLLLIFLLFSVANINAQKDPNIVPGRSGIVELFEWKFSDIAAECERFLAPRGYGGVQVSPVQENLVVAGRPWWERYQVISYQIISRSGDAAAFSDMVTRCNNVGIRIYVDVVLNDIAPGYPSELYGPGDFHPPCFNISFQDPASVRNCTIGGLLDLDQSLPHVRQVLIEFLNRLIDIGVAGFRVDAAKHMWPEDLQYIFSHLNNLSTAHGFAPGSRPFIYQEVIDYGGEAITASEYTDIGRVTEFKYGRELSNSFRGNNAIKWLQNFGERWGFLPDGDALVFVDNHDTQRGGYPILTYKESKLYMMAVAFMLAWPYGYPRVMSSYFFNNLDQGPPHDDNDNILSPTINSDETCGNGWVCEHRWRQIVNMVEFRNVVEGTDVNDWWDNGDKQIAFCREGKGFVAFNDQYNTDMLVTLQTCLPPGTYCDVVSGSKIDGSCTGKRVHVLENGTAFMVILNEEEDGVLAIHAGSKVL